MEGRRGQTYSSDDRQKLCSRCTDSDDSLQLFGRLQYPKVYLQKAWTRVYQCTQTLPPDNTVHPPQHRRQAVIPSLRRRLVERVASRHNFCSLQTTAEDFLVKTFLSGHSCLTVVFSFFARHCFVVLAVISYLDHVKPFHDDDDDDDDGNGNNMTNDPVINDDKDDVKKVLDEAS